MPYRKDGAIDQSSLMPLVVIDSNAVFKDPWLSSEPGMHLLDLAARGACSVVYPQVVLDELLRQQHEWVESSRGEIDNTIAKLQGKPLDLSETASKMKESFDGLAARVDQSFRELTGQPGFEIAPVPSDPDLVADLVKRDLDRRRPFLEVGSEGWSAGYRDAVIWETVLSLVDELDGDEKLIFVTTDKGFLADNKKSLHSDLLADLDSRGIQRDVVIYAQGVFRATAEVEADSRSRELVKVATDELFGLDGKSIALQAVYADEYGFPEFVKFEVPPIEGAEIAALDQNTPWEFDNERDGIVRATAEAVVAIEGLIEKSAWEPDDEIDVDVSSDWHDWYFQASTTIFVQAVCEIHVSGGLGQFRVQSIVLEDVPAQRIKESNRAGGDH